MAAICHAQPSALCQGCGHCATDPRSTARASRRPEGFVRSTGYPDIPDHTRPYPQFRRAFTSQSLQSHKQSPVRRIHIHVWRLRGHLPEIMVSDVLTFLHGKPQTRRGAHDLPNMPFWQAIWLLSRAGGQGPTLGGSRRPSGSDSLHRGVGRERLDWGRRA